MTYGLVERMNLPLNLMSLILLKKLFQQVLQNVLKLWKMIKEGDYLIKEGRSVVHILKMDETSIIYEQGWYSVHVFGISAGYGISNVDLKEKFLEEPICYYNSWINFFEETYEETDKETYDKIFQKAKEITIELDMLKTKLKLTVDKF